MMTTDRTTDPAAPEETPTDAPAASAPAAPTDTTAETGAPEAIEKSEVDVLREALNVARAREARALADYQNLQRRASDARAEVHRVAVADVVAGLLPVLDDLERAVESAPDDVKDHPWAEGVRLVLQGFHRALEQRGVEQIHALNQPFDPNQHEAVGEAPGPEQQVVHLVRRGYVVQGRVIRPAMVMVGAGE
jgi:molecular chaperone GrpE